MAFLVFAHVNAHQCRFVVEEVGGQRFGQFGFAHARRTQKQKAADGLFGVLHSRPRAAHGIGNGLNGLVLPNHALVEFFFEIQQFFALALQHFLHGYTRPFGHDFGNISGSYFRTTKERFSSPIGGGGGFFFQFRNFTIPNFGHLTVVARALGLVGFEFERVELLFQGTFFVYLLFFHFPLRPQFIAVFVEVGNFFVEAGFFFFVVFAANGFSFYFQLHHAAVEFVEFFGYRVHFQTQFGRRLVHQINGFVGQKTVGDVTVGEFDGGNNSIVLDAHAVVEFVFFFDTAQNRNGIWHVGFVHQNQLKTPLQSLVFFDVFLVFFKRGGSNGVQFAARQCGFEQVGRVHGTFAAARANERVDFVNKQNNLPVAVGYFLDYGFESFFKFAFVFGTRNEQTHVERHHNF